MSSPRKRWLAARVRDYLMFDARWLRPAGALALLVAGRLLFALGDRRRGLKVLTKVHRSNASDLGARSVERVLGAGGRRPAPVLAELRRYASDPPIAPGVQAHAENPDRLIGKRMLVLKPYRPGEKGIIVIDYSYTFPIISSRLDLAKLGARYHLVLEPSWSGYCDLDVLAYAHLDFPVFVQSTEPRDTRFMETLDANLVPVPTSANWWVDHRQMRPLPEVAKDVDFLCVAAWGSYKRHAHLFHALGRLKRQGEKFNVLLVGYPLDMTKDQVFQLAQDFGLGAQVELRERLKPDEVNVAFNRARVNVLWSRREGVNRAVVEGLFAGTPCVLRTGFNFGYPYPFVNPATGCFTSEAELPATLLRLREQALTPRSWVLEHMSCQRAAEVLGASVRAVATRLGEDWTVDPVPKVSHLDRMSYFDEADRERFAADYEFVRSVVRGAGTARSPSSS